MNGPDFGTVSIYVYYAGKIGLVRDEPLFRMLPGFIL